jgi:hypothetical protein
MKSIQNQYRDLKEGKMSQANFMRNLRMTMPQYITNVTSFGDAVKILRNKSILTENMGPKPEETNDELDAMIKSIEGEKAGEEEVKAQYDIAEFHSGNPNDKYVVKKSDTGWCVWEGDVKVDEFETEEEAKEFADEKNAAQELNEARAKKEPKAELHPNQIHPQELRMGIKVELEHTDELDKAKKIALDHLAENPFYYTALKLSGIESPSVFTAKPPVKKGKKKETIQLVDLANGMKKVKMPKVDEKKKIKEARFNVIGEPNAVAKQVMQFVEGNATLKALSDDIEIQQTSNPNEALLRYQYWDVLPSEAVEKLKLQFKVERDGDYDEDTGEIIFYRLTPLRNFGSKDLGASFEKFKSQLEEIVREVLSEMQSDDQEIDDMAMSMDEYFDGRDNLINPLSAEDENN